MPILRVTYWKPKRFWRFLGSRVLVDQMIFAKPVKKDLEINGGSAGQNILKVGGFRPFHEESAIREFGLLLKSSNIRIRRREKLKTFFRDFQEHHRIKFWADRTLQLNTKMIVRRAGVIVQDSGVIQAKVACEEFFSSEGRGLFDLELMDNSESQGDAEDSSESKGDAEES
ncbi:hypothetical protein BGZ95_005013 [Linnemannia exigua]|uniref:Uncharacterized protein n=1 Tax=Linnemannia exigua TaxID=604196 RepID=A0AAD4DHG1_9FUNG|nr:hypothetical protein BGZ95_005013 [Linnemannia exigua]